MDTFVHKNYLMTTLVGIISSDSLTICLTEFYSCRTCSFASQYIVYNSVATARKKLYLYIRFYCQISKLIAKKLSTWNAAISHFLLFYRVKFIIVAKDIYKQQELVVHFIHHNAALYGLGPLKPTEFQYIVNSSGSFKK